MKKVLMSFIVAIFMIFAFAWTGENQVKASSLKDKNGEVIIHPLSNGVVVDAPEYQAVDTEFRATWVSFYAKDIGNYSSVAQMKKQLLNVLSEMEKYHMNAIMFHIRTHNDACYPTNLAPISDYVKDCDFEQWDYLEWFINECHKRGIEFHAWLNPYRISYDLTKDEILKKYKTCTMNPACNPNNILINDAKSSILDPGRPAVQDYVVKVCMEVCEKYNIDAIHFDDYFYISDVDDTKTREQYNTKKLSVENFRRASVDAMIEKLSNALDEFNEKNNKTIQLGISPSAVYNNIGSYISPSNYKYDEKGNLTFPLGSSSSGYAHYVTPLFCDTKKWAEEGWIDYLIPQLYNAIKTSAASYVNIAEWWNGVFKNLKANLYIGQGLYMWYNDPTEWKNELRINQGLESIKGFSVYSEKTLRTTDTTQGNKIVKDECLTNYTKLPVLENFRGKYTTTQTKSVQNLKIFNHDNAIAFAWDKLENTKAYYIYQYKDKLDLSDPKQIVGMSGNDDNTSYCSFNIAYDASLGQNFAIVPLTLSNETCKEAIISINEVSAFDENYYNAAQLYDVEITGKVEANWEVSLRFTEGVIDFGTTLTYEAYICPGKTWDESKMERINVIKQGDTYLMYYKISAFGEPFTYELKE